MKILITGGAGFIGSNLVEKLVSLNHELLILDDFSTGNEFNLKDFNVDLYRGSVLDKDLVHRLTVNVDAVVHLAALGSVPRSLDYPQDTFEANCVGSFNILEAARKYGFYTILSSSSSVYGPSKKLPISESRASNPVSPYGSSKLCAESFFISYQKSLKVDNLVFRFFNVFGPRQSFGNPYSAVIPNFIRACLKNIPVTLYGSGLQSRDFTYVDTVTETIISALNKRLVVDSPINLAIGQSISLLKILNYLEEISGKQILVDKKNERDGDIFNSLSDPTLFRKFFNTPQSNFKNLLKKTYIWYQENSD